MQENELRGEDRVYMNVTRRILENISEGKIPWRKTWFPRKGQENPYFNPITGTKYSLLNRMLLGEPGRYSTMKQINDKGGRVNKGTKSRMVTFWDFYIPKSLKEEEKRLREEGKSIEHLKVPCLKSYLVYNLRDTTGMEKYMAAEDENQVRMQAAEAPVDIADMVIRDYCLTEGITLRKDSQLYPGWNIEENEIEMPTKELFELEEDWYASLFSEAAHSTSTPERCDRKEEYRKLMLGETSPREELTAEIASSMILQVCGLERRQTHLQIEAECQKWTEMLEEDYRLFVRSAGKAEKAATYILGDFAA